MERTKLCQFACYLVSMNLITRLFVALYAWIPLLLWVTQQPEASQLAMWPMIDTVMVGLLLALGSAATIILLPPRQATQLTA